MKSNGAGCACWSGSKRMARNLLPSLRGAAPRSPSRPRQRRPPSNRIPVRRRPRNDGHLFACTPDEAAFQAGHATESEVHDVRSRRKRCLHQRRRAGDHYHRAPAYPDLLGVESRSVDETATARGGLLVCVCAFADTRFRAHLRHSRGEVCYRHRSNERRCRELIHETGHERVEQPGYSTQKGCTPSKRRGILSVFKRSPRVLAPGAHR